MSDDDRPIDTITRLVEERRRRSDATILAELRALPLLPDEDDPAWDDGSTWDHHADVILALAAVVRERRLHEGVLLLLERACYGDPGEIMRGLRHTLEAVYNPDWSALQDVCIAALGSPHAGARLWAADELAVVGDARAVPTLVARPRDERSAVRAGALGVLARVAGRDRAGRVPVIAALQTHLEQIQDAVEARNITGYSGQAPARTGRIVAAA